MYGQAHAGLGWIIGAVAPGADRRLRAWCLGAALLPDADAAAMLFGIDAYNRWHHKPGHNVFLGLICVFVAAAHFWKYPLRQRLTAAVLVGVCFASHLLTDMKLSGWQVFVLWPYSDRPFAFEPNYSLGAPVNTVLVYVLMTVPFVLALWRPATPLELISPRLDRLVMNAFRKKTAECASCRTACNNVCDGCGRPACMKHGRIDWRFRLTCPACVTSGSPRPPSPPPA
jgi:hypothetical protein